MPLRSTDLRPDPRVQRALRRARIAYGFGIRNGRPVLISFEPLQRFTPPTARVELEENASRADIAEGWRRLLAEALRARKVED